MTLKNETITADAGAPDTLETEAGLVDADAALAAELGLPGEENGESTQTTPDEDAESDRVADDVETGLEEDEADADEADVDADDEDADSDEDSDEDADADEADDESDEDADEDEPEGKDLFGSIPKEHHKAVGKLITQAKQKERGKTEQQIAAAVEAEQAKVADVEAQLASVKAQKVVPAPTHESPYADIFDGGELQEVESQLWELKQQLTEDPESYQVPDKTVEGGKRYASEQEVRQAKAIIDRRLQRDLPARKRWLEQHAQYDGALAAAAPEVNDPKSELHQAINQMVSSLPLLKTIPGYRNTAAIQVLGQRLLHAKGADSFTFVNRLIAAAEGEAKGGNTESGKRKSSKKTVADKVKRKKAPKPVSSRGGTRRTVSTSAGRGGFSESAFEAEILGDA